MRRAFTRFMSSPSNAFSAPVLTGMTHHEPPPFNFDVRVPSNLDATRRPWSCLILACAPIHLLMLPYGTLCILLASS